MRVFAVLLKGQANAVLTLRQSDQVYPVAVFPLENLLGVIDLSTKTLLTDEEAAQKIKELGGAAPHAGASAAGD